MTPDELASAFARGFADALQKVAQPEAVGCPAGAGEHAQLRLEAVRLASTCGGRIDDQITVARLIAGFLING